jgi:uncharacterized protein (DUF1330 family)
MGGALGTFAARTLIALDKGPAQPGDDAVRAERQQRFGALLERLGDQPVDMLNLLKFKPGGEASYAAYGREFATLIPEHAPGTQVVYWADCAGLLVGSEEWDRLIIVRYPSMAAFLALTTSADYAAIAHLRTDALERAVLYAMVPSPPQART